MISAKDFKNPWTYLWIIGTILLYWFVLYHVLTPFKQFMLHDVEATAKYPRLLTHNFWVLFLHIAPSILAAILMPWQFFIFRVKALRKTHKIFGYICLICTFFAAPTAAYLSYTADTVFLTSTGNALAAAGWCVALWIAYYHIRKGNIEKHKRWMIRTYTFFLDGAVLRFIYTELEMFSKAGSTEYNPEAWLAWAAPWILIEILFLIENSKKKSTR